MTRTDNAGPFYCTRWLYRLGFRWFEKMYSTKHVPGPTGYTDWHTDLHRLQWHRIPLTPWLEGPAAFKR